MMEMTEALQVYTGIENAPRTDTPEGRWGLRLLPASISIRSLHRSRELLLVLGTGLILALSYLRPLYVKLPGGGAQICWFHRVTGIPCLLCGMTRSLAAAARLQFGESFYLHRLGPFLFLLLAVVFLGSLTLLASGQRLEWKIPRDARRQLSWFLLVLLVAAWIVKMIAFGANV
jgi:hypothetical protein